MIRIDCDHCKKPIDNVDCGAESERIVIRIVCDHCKKPIDNDGCVYVLAVYDPERLDVAKPLWRRHLHWLCVPLYGRNEANGDPH